MPAVHGLYTYIYVSITHVHVPYMHVRPLLQMPIRECGGEGGGGVRIARNISTLNHLTLRDSVARGLKGLWHENFNPEFCP